MYVSSSILLFHSQYIYTSLASVICVLSVYPLKHTHIELLHRVLCVPMGVCVFDFDNRTNEWMDEKIS